MKTRCVLLALVLLAAGCAHPKPALPAAKSAPPAPVVAAAPAPAVAPAATAPAATAATPGAAGAPAARPSRPPGPPPLVGPVTRADLEDYITWKELRAQDYIPDASAVAAIGQRGAGLEVVAIVATWCPDSKREVPRFFKIADLARFSLSSVKMVAVDRTKKDADGLTEKLAVTRVPTFVFFRDGKEIGRITERPVTTLEGEMATILGAKQP